MQMCDNIRIFYILSSYLLIKIICTSLWSRNGTSTYPGKHNVGGGHTDNVRRVTHCRLERGDGGAPGTNLPQPGVPREAPGGGEVDHRAWVGRGPPAGVLVHKDGGTGDGVAAHQTPRVPDTNRRKPGIIPQPPSRAITRGHHRWHGDGGRGATLGRGRTGHYWIGIASTLAPAVWGGRWGALVDCQRLCGVVRKWAAFLGRL